MLGAHSAWPATRRFLSIHLLWWHCSIVSGKRLTLTKLLLLHEDILAIDGLARWTDALRTRHHRFPIF